MIGTYETINRISGVAILSRKIAEMDGSCSSYQVDSIGSGSTGDGHGMERIWGSPGLGEVDGVAVVGDLEVVGIRDPSCSLADGDGEGVGAGDEGERLHPSEVSRAILRAQANEVGVYVEVGVGDEAKVLVLAAVEVEYDAVAADDLGVAAHAPLLIAVRCDHTTIIQVMQCSC